MIPGYRYRYAPTDTDTDTDTNIPNIPHTEPIPGSYRFFFIQIPIPGIGTWYRYHTGYWSNSIAHHTPHTGVK